MRTLTFNQIPNQIIINLVNYDPNYPWASYISNSLSQFENELPRLIESKSEIINIYLNTDDGEIQFNIEFVDPEDIEPDFTFEYYGINYQVYFD